MFQSSSAHLTCFGEAFILGMQQVEFEVCLFLSPHFLAKTSHILRVPKFETDPLVVVALVFSFVVVPSSLVPFSIFGLRDDSEDNCSVFSLPYF